CVDRLSTTQICLASCCLHCMYILARQARGNTHAPPVKETSYARAKRFLGEQLDRPRHDGADVSTSFRPLPAASADDGGAGADEEEEAAEALTAQGAEEGQEIAAQGQGEEGRQEEEAGGQETSPLAHLVDHRGSAVRMAQAISLGRSRGAFQSSFLPKSGSMYRAWYLVLAVAACSAPKVPLGAPHAE